MKNYAIFIDNMEIHIKMKVGTIESLNTLKEEIKGAIKGNPTQEHGYAEQYPFYQADWEIVGYGFTPGFDINTILEVS